MQTKYDIRIEQEDISEVKRKFSVTVPAETVDSEIRSMYQSLKSTVAIAGFRKGNIPVNILKARFSDHVREEVTKKLVENSYVRSLQEKGLIPIEPPKVELKPDALEEGKDFSYTMTFEVTPKVEVDGYMGMPLKKEPVEVTDKDVDEGLERLRQARAEFKEVERPAGEKDLVVVDFEAFIEGKPVTTQKAADYSVIIGEFTPWPGFDEALKGATKGETRTAPITFPGNISEKDIAGKTAEFKITVKAIKEKLVPAIDDELAKDLGRDNAENLKAWVREELTKVKDAHEKERIKNAILDTLLEKHAFEVPESMLKRYTSVILNKVVENMRLGHFEPGDRELSVDQLKDKYAAVALRSAKEDIVLDAIAAKENVEVTPEETEKAVRSLAASRGVTYESLMARIENEGALELIKDGLKHEKVFEKIIEASTPA